MKDTNRLGRVPEATLQVAEILRLIPEAQLEETVEFLKCVEAEGATPEQFPLRDMLASARSIFESFRELQRLMLKPEA